MDLERTGLNVASDLLLPCQHFHREGPASIRPSARKALENFPVTIKARNEFESTSYAHIMIYLELSPAPEQDGDLFLTLFVEGSI